MIKADHQFLKPIHTDAAWENISMIMGELLSGACLGGYAEYLVDPPLRTIFDRADELGTVLIRPYAQFLIGRMNWVQF